MPDPERSLSGPGPKSFLKKKKSYARVRFAADVIKEASAVFDAEIGPDEGNPALFLVAEVDGAEWRYDSEDEFFAGYRLGARSASYHREVGRSSLRIQAFDQGDTTIEVAASQRSKIEAVYEVFEKHLFEARLPEPAETAPRYSCLYWTRSQFGLERPERPSSG